MVDQTGEAVAGTQQDPDQIAREIERTRAELAETIDAIAEKVSPKRAASRGATKVRTAAKAGIESVRARTGGDGMVESAPSEWAASEPPPPGGLAGTEPTAEVVDPRIGRAGPEVSPGQAAASGVPDGHPYLAAPGVVRVAGEPHRVLRKGRVAVAAGATAAAWYLLRRRSSS